MEPRREKEAGPIPLVPDVGRADADVLDGWGSDDSLVGLWEKNGNNVILPGILDIIASLYYFYYGSFHGVGAIFVIYIYQNFRIHLTLHKSSLLESHK